MPQGSALNSPSRLLRAVPEVAEVGDLLRRQRRDRQWTQQDLAAFCAVRTQTVSAWERGHRPQRRFVSKIAEFLGRTPEDIESMLSDEAAGSAQLVPGQTGPPPDPTELQLRVIEAVTNYVGSGKTLSPGMIGLLEKLMASVGLPGDVALAPQGLSTPASHEP